MTIQDALELMAGTLELTTEDDFGIDVRQSQCCNVVTVEVNRWDGEYVLKNVTMGEVESPFIRISIIDQMIGQLEKTE